MDLLVGNDFEVGDQFYLGDSMGHWRQVTAQDGLIPFSAKTTMSMVTTDVNNDSAIRDLY